MIRIRSAQAVIDVTGAAFAFLGVVGGRVLGAWIARKLWPFQHRPTWQELF